MPPDPTSGRALLRNQVHTGTPLYKSIDPLLLGIVEACQKLQIRLEKSPKMASEATLEHQI